ncbi:hypothetical protein [Nocardioides dongkuii]|uniref:hypothetical protein n=1 Tax=Nocardioides dongkuii TaxID=2760089 RepID=UPI0015F8260C|nr:hypothetical protein [Nocardioides dongkuii]
MAFSPAGLALSLAVLAPNLLMLRFPPRDPLPSVRAPRVVSGAERAGQALCLVVPAASTHGPTEPAWAALVAGCLAGYYGLWVRYLRGGRGGAALYEPVWGVPVPMAVLPVLAFLAASAWLGNPWIAVSAVVLAVGHVPAALLVGRAMTADPVSPRSTGGRAGP